MIHVRRFAENPLIVPERVQPWHPNCEIVGAFNAGVARFQNETLLLLRIAERPIAKNASEVPSLYFDPVKKRTVVRLFNRNDPSLNFEDSRTIRPADRLDHFIGLTSLSYLRLARSHDGRHFTVDDRPFIYPSNRRQMFGVEDPRITQIGNTYYIYFSAVSPEGIGINLVTTEDFEHYDDHGLIFAPENKDTVIFPEKINGKFYALNRPSPKSIGDPDIWIAESNNLKYWGNHRHLLSVRPSQWDAERIGSGAVPILTEKGWLEIYHGATPNGRYCLGALLLDRFNPAKILARSKEPILEPEADYEKKGFFGEVVFTCGGLARGDTLRLYYGAADRSMAGAELKISEILQELGR